MRLKPGVIVEFGRQRLGQTCLAHPAEILADGPLSEAEAPGNDVLRQAGRMAKPKQFAKMAHGQSLGGHLVSLVERARLTVVEDRQWLWLPTRPDRPSRSPETMITMHRKP